jgi:hypothetical protein
VEFDFGCKFMFVTGKIEFYVAAIILPINAKRVLGLRFAMLASGRDVTGSAGSGSVIYDKVYYLMIKSYSSVVVVKFTTKVEFY